MTAKQLAKKHPDIAQTTLYRYLKRMINDEIIKVAEENVIRGTVEKTYTLAIDFSASVENIVKSNSGDAYMTLFMQYISGFVKVFREYCQREDINIREDISTFAAAPFYATNDELETAMLKIGDVVTGLTKNEPSEGRKLRNMGVMVTPPQGVEEKRNTQETN